MINSDSNNSVASAAAAGAGASQESSLSSPPSADSVASSGASSSPSNSNVVRRIVSDGNCPSFSSVSPFTAAAACTQRSAGDQLLASASSSNPNASSSSRQLLATTSLTTSTTSINHRRRRRRCSSPSTPDPDNIVSQRNNNSRSPSTSQPFGGAKRRRAADGVAEQLDSIGQQCATTTRASAGPSSASGPESEPLSGSEDVDYREPQPPLKKLKMASGIAAPTTATTSAAAMHTSSSCATSSSLSVAQRLKQSSLKDNIYGMSPLIKPPPRQRSLSQKTQNTVRVIAQYLRDLGLNESVEALVGETGCKVENTHAARLRNAIYKGDWDDALDVIDKCYSYLTAEQLNQTKLLFMEEKFYSLLHAKKHIQALWMLRHEFPVELAGEKRHKSLIKHMFMSTKKLATVPEANRSRTKKDRKKLALRLQKTLPASFMLPPNRLNVLLNHAHKHQISRCDFHVQGSSDKKAAMPAEAVFNNHQCCHATPPEKYQCVQSLMHHVNEVWVCEFSPCGNMLATASRSNSVIIWRVHKSSGKVRLYKELSMRESHDYIAYVSWSFDGKYLAVCGTDQDPFDLVVFNVFEGTIHRLLRGVPLNNGTNHHPGPIARWTCCAFFAGKSRGLIAANDKGIMHVYDMDQPEEVQPRALTGYRMKCVYGMKDGRTIFAADTHNRIRRYFAENNRDEETLFTEECQIITFKVHPSEKFILSSTLRNIRLWDIENRCLVRYFSGAHQNGMIIHPTMGGVNGAFIASGTYDSKVAIWDMEDCRPTMFLKGHKSMVNAVTWNPKHPTMIASVSEDMSVRIWRISKVVTSKPSSIIQINNMQEAKNKTRHSSAVKTRKLMWYSNDEEEAFFDGLEHMPGESLLDGQSSYMMQMHALRHKKRQKRMKQLKEKLGEMTETDGMPINESEKLIDIDGPPSSSQYKSPSKPQSRNRKSKHLSRRFEFMQLSDGETSRRTREKDDDQPSTSKKLDKKESATTERNKELLAL